MPVPAVTRLVDRPELTARLRLALQKPLTLIHAPAGYGKTSAAVLGVASYAAPVAWYTAQAWHAGRFVEPLVDEVRRARDDLEFGRLTLAIAAQTETAGAGADAPLSARAQAAGATFANELGHVDLPILAVIDDAHLLHGAFSLDDFVAGAMRVLPRNAHLLVLSRALPAFGVAELVLQDRAEILDAADLTMDAPQTAALARARNIQLDDRAAAALCNHCEGWAAGIALSMNVGGKLLPSSGGSQPAVVAYLVDQNIAALPERLVSFVESTCVMETLQAQLLARSTEYGDAHDLLLELERRGFMIEAVEPGGTYRVHPLLREALLKRVRARDGDDAVVALHAAAARALLRGGQAVPALYHYEKGNDDEGVLEVLRSHGEDLIAAGRRALVLETVGRARERGVDGAVFGLLEGITLRQRGEDEAARVFARALADALATRDSLVEIRLRQLIVQDELSRGVGVADIQSDELLERTRGRGGELESGSLVLAGWVAAIRGDFRRSVDFARDAAALLGTGANVRKRTDAVLLHSYALTCLGEFAPADSMLGATVRSLEGSDHVVVLAYLLTWYARMALLWGDFRSAGDYASAGAAKGSNFNLPAELGAAYAAIAEVRAHAGDARGCAEAASRTREFAASAWYGADRKRLFGAADQFAARSEFLQGDAAAALSAARAAAKHSAASSTHRAALLADAAAFGYVADDADATALISAAEEAIAGAKPDDGADAVSLSSAAAMLGLVRGARLMPARRSVSELTSLAPYGGLLHARVDFAIVRRIGVAIGEMVAAPDRSDSPLAEYAEALRTLERQGPRFEGTIARAFTGRIARGRPKLAAALRASGDDLEAKSARPSIETTSKLTELTRREREILNFLAAGLTNKEIAHQLVLSVRTVDTHVDRVLGKLDVTSRTRAAAVAARLGLINAVPGP